MLSSDSIDVDRSARGESSDRMDWKLDRPPLTGPVWFGDGAGAQRECPTAEPGIDRVPPCEFVEVERSVCSESSNKLDWKLGRTHVKQCHSSDVFASLW